jgi:hypothetical protein
MAHSASVTFQCTILLKVLGLIFYSVVLGTSQGKCLDFWNVSLSFVIVGWLFTLVELCFETYIEEVSQAVAYLAWGVFFGTAVVFIT